MYTHAGVPSRTSSASCLGPTNPFIVFPPKAIEASIPTRFEQQVCLYPDRVAVKTAHEALTYEALNALANQIAWALLDRLGSGAEPVALLFEPGAPLVAATLGLLKAGKIYAPLDPTFPAPRLAATLADTQARLIVTHSAHRALAQAVAPLGCQVLTVDAEVSHLATANPALPIAPDTLAYIFYTSGSTGRPKGVLHSHRTVLHAIAGFTNAMHICSADRLTSFYACGVIALMKDMLQALLNGAALHPFGVKSAGLVRLASWLRQEGLTMYHSTPTLFRHLCGALTGVEGLPGLRLVRLGGETVTRRDVELFQQSCAAGCLLYSGLATTESGGSIRKIFLDRETRFVGSVVPCGYASADMDVLILNEDGSQVPGDGIGEIAVKSCYLALGYWRQPDLTQAVFLPDPAGSDARIYRTGDLGRLLPDGSLEHLGRKDFQVKVRGYRVETAEVELALLEHPLVKEAVVVARAEPAGETRLVAYVVPAGSPAPTRSALGRFLQSKLPDYMVPATFVTLDALPLTPNDKIDRLALPAPAPTRPALATPYRAPRTPIEEQLVQIWSDVLGLAEVGVQEAFLDLGGHSILAMQIVARVRAAWHIDIPLRTLLETPTIAQMAVAIVCAQAGQMSEETFAALLHEVEETA